MELIWVTFVRWVGLPVGRFVCRKKCGKLSTGVYCASALDFTNVGSVSFLNPKFDKRLIMQSIGHKNSFHHNELYCEFTVPASYPLTSAAAASIF